MLRVVWRVLLVALLALVLVGIVLYFQSPQFWTRYVNTFRSGGLGADAPVFDHLDRVPASSAPAEIPLAVPSRLSADTQLALTEYAAAFDSFALIVVHGGRIQLEWYKDGYTRNSLTQSQSMHKSLQGLLIGIALDKGLIDSLDTPVSEYVPALAGTDKDTISFRQALTMSTGLKPFEGGFSPFGEAFRWLYAEDLDAATLAVPVTDTPGSDFDYHDANSQLLGMAIRRVFGKPYSEVLYEQLWDPIGAGSADVWLDRDGGIAHHNCCLLARAIDWARIGQLLLDDGFVGERSVVSSEWIARQTRASNTPHYGFQTWIASNDAHNPRQGGGGYRRTEDWLADDVFYFSGYGAQRVYVSKARDLVVVRLGPAAGYFPKIAEEWDNTFLFNTAVRGLGIADGNR